METTNEKATEHPVDAAARIVGGRSALADRLDVSVAAIGNWKTRGVPIEKCPRIERLTDTKVTRQVLRPNDWQEIWPELAQSPANTQHTATENVAQGV